MNLCQISLGTHGNATYDNNNDSTHCNDIRFISLQRAEERRVDIPPL